MMPFIDVVKQSFLGVFKRFDVVLKICAVWCLILIFEAATGFSSYCVIGKNCVSNDNIAIFSSLLFAIAGVGIATSYIKNSLLGKEVKYGQLVFGKTELKYFGFSVLMLLFTLVPAILIIFSAAFVFAMFNVQNTSFSSFIFFGAPLVFLILFSRLYIKFAAIAVGDNLSIKQTFILTKGNTFKLFFGQLLMVVPTLLLYSLLAFVFDKIGSNGFVAKFIFTAFLMALSFFDSVLKASFYSEAYKCFVKIEKKKSNK